MKHQRTGSRWRLLRVPARDGATNMARDAALMSRARESGETVFSVYSWERPTLSLGRNQQALGCYDPAAIANAKVDVVRRPTGGRALLHHHEVTYSVTAPLGSHDSLRESYRRINRILLHGLRSLGIKATEAPPPTVHPMPGSLPCFAEPAEGELVVNGAKLVGSAQYREEGALLQHGSILLRDDQAFIASLLVTPHQSDTARAATLTQSMGRQPAFAEVADALFTAVLEVENGAATHIDEEELKLEVDSRRPGFADPRWTWRR